MQLEINDMVFINSKTSKYKNQIGYIKYFTAHKAYVSVQSWNSRINRYYKPENLTLYKKAKCKNGCEIYWEKIGR